MRLRTLVGLWLPLAISVELMMLEGPTVQAAMGRLPAPPLNLAAWGLTISLSMLVESPVIMLLSTAIALVRDRDSYVALRRFMVRLLWGCTALTALIAFTPLFTFIAGRVMGQPAPIVAAARPAMQIMLLWTAAIGWRRFYQGILVRYGQTRMVTFGTAIRLSVAVTTALGLAHWGHLPGVQVGAAALMAAVLAEAVATTGFALPVVRRHVLTESDAGATPLTQSAIWQFHLPLAATMLLTLLAQPLTAAALARLDAPAATLAVWPVASMIMLVLRGWGFALQEITVAQAPNPQARPVLRRFAWIVGLVTTAALILIAVTPLLTLYLTRVVALTPALHGYARIALLTGCSLPLLTALGSWARGLLVASGQTQAIYRGMGLNLATHVGLLLLSVLLRLPGMVAAGGAFTLAALAELFYLLRVIREERIPFEKAAPVELCAADA